jgi:hypothetical protein
LPTDHAQARALFELAARPLAEEKKTTEDVQVGGEERGGVVRWEERSHLTAVTFCT